MRETTNFRILRYGSAPPAASVGDTCEAVRTELRSKWLGDSPDEAWVPKCDVVLHPSDVSYLREVGVGGQSTVASSLVDKQVAGAVSRRIDIRSAKDHWQVDSLPHEMTHVILADQLSGQQLPRWIDEGMALLADPAGKQERHQADLRTALANGRAFRVVELLALDGYPPADRWGAFYGQSVSLARYLVGRDSPERFVKFARLSRDAGYEVALREIYQINGVADLERRWQTEVGAKTRQNVSAVAKSRGVRPARLPATSISARGVPN